MPTILKFKMRRTLLLLLFIFVIQSCKTQKDVIYFQNVDEVINNNPDLFQNPKIQAGDLLSIVVSSYHMDAVIPFNLAVGVNASDEQSNARGQLQVQNYLVDSNGMINFPVLGEIHASEKDRQTLAKELQERIKVYVKEPIVTIRLLNFKYTVLGEVKNPGVFTTDNERISFLEALGSAKDLTIYGRRDSIILIRNEDNIIKKHYIDLRDASMVDSTYYFLRQNDVVYVQPNEIKTRESKVSPFNPLMVSIASVTLALITLLTR